MEVVNEVKVHFTGSLLMKFLMWKVGWLRSKELNEESCYFLFLFFFFLKMRRKKE